MSLRSGRRKLSCLFSAFWLCLFTGPLATPDSIASDESASPHHHERSAVTQHEPVYEKLPVRVVAGRGFGILAVHAPFVGCDGIGHCDTVAGRSVDRSPASAAQGRQRLD